MQLSILFACSPSSFHVHSLHLLPPFQPLPPLHNSSTTLSVRRRRFLTSISASAAAMSSGKLFRHYSPIELTDESDFDQIVSSDGLISVCGFGSPPFRAERSARSTFPELINFRVGKLSGFRRVFAHAAPIFFERGIAKPETKEISSLSVEPCEGETLIITIFEIQRSEIPSFIEREHEFRFLAVIPETLNGLLYTNPAVLCARYSDEEYFGIDAKEVKWYFSSGMEDMTLTRFGKMISYLVEFISGTAKNLGDMAYDNFLDHTFLGDRKTTIREYLSSTGSGIMEEELPEPLKTRYGG